MIHYLRKRKVSIGLQMRTRKYLEYMHNVETKGLNRGQEILQELTSSLQDQISYESYDCYFNKIPFFKKHFSSEFLKALSAKIKEIAVAPGEIICQVKLFYPL